MRRSERMERLSKLFAQIETNYRILEKYSPKSKGDWINYSDLLKEGFDPNRNFNFEKNNNTGIQYRVLLEYGFIQSKDNQYIQIHKL